MRRWNEGDVEFALRRYRPEPDAGFVRGLADDIRQDTREDRRRHPRRLSLGLAVALTALIMTALGAVGAFGAAGSPATGAVQVVKRAFSAPDNEVQLATNSPARDQYKPKCNSGRGNLSETETGTHQTNSSTLKNPHEGETGPGDHPTDDCDPGNSGPHNRGGD